MVDQYKRDYFHRRVSAMTVERQSFISHYKELAEFIQPRRGRFFISDRNKGDRRYSSIINSKATQAHRIARSGMLAGTMSPARPWFALETPDPDMMERSSVKEWLYKVELILRAIFNQSNFYNMAPVLLGELLLFGTGAMSQVDDFENVARFYTHTAGSYMIGQNEKLEIDTLVREFEWTVNQIVEEFGLENVSVFVKDQYDRGNYNIWTPVTHFIEPNPDADKRKPLSRFKPFRSVYYEPGNLDKNKFLRESGFDVFPAYCPRWDVTGEDVYGTDCPAMTALGDIKGLQIEEKRKAQAIDKMVNPPLKGPASLRNVSVSSLPGSLTIYDSDPQREVLQPLYVVNPQLQELRADIQAVERRIDTAFYVDLFLAISQIEGIQPRNEFDLAHRDAERLLQLGPVLERLHGEFLNHVIDRTFMQAVKANILPPPPPELQGMPLKVVYISTLAMAQRAVATGGIDRLAAYVGGLMKVGFTQAGDKFDADQSIDEYAKAIGTPPRVVVPDDDVNVIRQQRAQEQQAMQQAAMAEQVAGAIQKGGAGVKSLAGAMGNQ